MLRNLFWALCGIVMFSSITAALFAHYRIVDGDTSLALIVIALIAEGPMIVLAVLVDRKRKQERHARYQQAYPTHEAVLQAVDRAAVRDARDSKGNAHAARMLRTQVPGIPLAEAAKLVRSL